MRNLDDLAGSGPLGSSFQLSEDRLERFKPAVRNRCNYKSQMKSGQIVLLLQFPVDGNEDIEPLLCEHQQRTIFAGTPSRLSDRPDRVARKRGL